MSQCLLTLKVEKYSYLKYEYWKIIHSLKGSIMFTKLLELVVIIGKATKPISVAKK